MPGVIETQGRIGSNINIDFSPDHSVGPHPEAPASRVKWWGAKGDNVTNDAPAINAAIAYANAQTFPMQLIFDPGFYRCTSALTPITGPTRLVGGGTRSAIVIFAGNFDCLKFAGSGTRCADAGISDMGFYCDDMTGGTFLTVDFAQDMRFQNVLVSNAFNGCLIRQAGNTQFANIDMQPLRGTYGIKAYGDGLVYTSYSGAGRSHVALGTSNIQRSSNVAYTKPSIHINKGRGSLGDIITRDKGTGAGVLLQIDTDDWITEGNIAAVGWTVTRPASRPIMKTITGKAVLTVATLPSAAASGGERYMVSDATTTLALGIGTIVAGGGANVTPVYSDSTNWRYG